MWFTAWGAYLLTVQSMQLFSLYMYVPAGQTSHDVRSVDANLPTSHFTHPSPQSPALSPWPVFMFL